MPLTRDDAYKALAGIPDPEVPVISIVDLGIVRDVTVGEGSARVTITPTYSGCPAMKMIEDEIRSSLLALGFAQVSIETVFSPAWTTDWISIAARQRLKEYGIAPPGKAAPQELVSITPRLPHVSCPYCNSEQTELRSEFGSTACKAMYYCRGCSQPFEHFKAH